MLTTAKPNGGGWVLDGAKSVVLHGDGAHKLIVSARSSGERGDPDGISLFLVDAQAGGVARRAYPMRDGTRAAEIALSGVEIGAADMLGAPGAAMRVIERVCKTGIAAIARGGCRRDGSDARDDPRISEDTPAVRQADRGRIRLCSTARRRC